MTTRSNIVLKGVVKLQALVRGCQFRALVNQEILVLYSGWDPDFESKFNVFITSRKRKKAILIQTVYRNYRRRVKTLKCIRVVKNAICAFRYFFRKKIRWLKDNVGDSLFINASHTSQIISATKSFSGINVEFEVTKVPRLMMYARGSLFYRAQSSKVSSASVSRELGTVMRYANRKETDILYHIRFRQPFCKSQRSTKKPFEISGHGSRQHKVNLFQSKLDEMVSVRHLNDPSGSKLTGLFFVLRKTMDIYADTTVLYCGAAIELQRMWRGAYCRLKMIPLLITNIIEKRAAVLLQRWWRMETGLKKRFRILSIVLSAVRRINTNELCIDPLTYFQLLRADGPPLIVNSVCQFPEFQGIPIINLNGQVIFKKYNRKKTREFVNPSIVIASHPGKPGVVATRRPLEWRGISNWMTLIKLAREPRYNALSYKAGNLEDSDGIAEIKTFIYDENKEGERHHHRNLQRNFSESKIFFNLLSNGCTISAHKVDVRFEKKAGNKERTHFGSCQVVKLGFASVLEARCRCAMLMLASMDTRTGECITLLTISDLNERMCKLAVLSENVPLNIRNQLYARADIPIFHGDEKEAIEVKGDLLKKPLNQTIWCGLRTVNSERELECWNDLAIVLEMESQIPMYVYDDLFSMGVLSDSNSSGKVNIRLESRNITPVPMLRPIRDPLEYILRVSAWPVRSSTPAWLRRERRCGDDLVKFQFFLESLMMYPDISSCDHAQGIIMINNGDLVHAGGSDATVKNVSIGAGGRSGSLRPSSIYKNRSANDSTGLDYWYKWEAEIPCAALNGIRPHPPLQRVDISVGGAPNDDLIMGVFPTDPRPSSKPELLSTDKVMYPSPVMTDTFDNEDLAADEYPLDKKPVAIDASFYRDPMPNRNLTAAKNLSMSYGVSWAHDQGPLGPNESPRWLRRHLWSIPRMLGWCSSTLDDAEIDKLRQDMTMKKMDGYIALMRERRGLKASEDTLNVAPLELENRNAVLASRGAVKKSDNKCVAASARLEIIKHVRAKAKALKETRQVEETPLSSPRPQSPFFHQVDFPVYTPRLDRNSSSPLRRRTQTAAGARTASPGALELTRATSPITGSNPDIRSGREEFVYNRSVEAKDLRQKLEMSRYSMDIENERILKEKKEKIRNAKEHNARFDLKGKLNKKINDRCVENMTEKAEWVQHFVDKNEERALKEEQLRELNKKKRELQLAKNLHRVDAIKNNVTLCALSKYAKISQLKEYKERERQKIVQEKTRRAQSIRASRHPVSASGREVIEHAVLSMFEDSSITDSLTSNELQQGILEVSDMRGVVEVRERSSSFATAASNKYVSEVMLLQAEISKNVEAAGSILSRSSHHKLDQSSRSGKSPSTK